MGGAHMPWVCNPKGCVTLKGVYVSFSDWDKGKARGNITAKMRGAWSLELRSPQLLPATCWTSCFIPYWPYRKVGVFTSIFFRKLIICTCDQRSRAHMRLATCRVLNGL